LSLQKCTIENFDLFEKKKNNSSVFGQFFEFFEKIEFNSFTKIASKIQDKD
jgi:hypothetical protein